jgi:hypothetical protein
VNGWHSSPARPPGAPTFRRRCAPCSRHMLARACWTVPRPTWRPDPSGSPPAAFLHPAASRIVPRPPTRWQRGHGRGPWRERSSSRAYRPLRDHRTDRRWRDGLLWSDVDLPEETVTWRAELDKAGRSTVTALTPAAAEALRTAPSRGIGDAPVFPSATDPSRPTRRHMLHTWLRRGKSNWTRSVPETEREQLRRRLRGVGFHAQKGAGVPEPRFRSIEPRTAPPTTPPRWTHRSSPPAKRLHSGESCSFSRSRPRLPTDPSLLTSLSSPSVRLHFLSLRPHDHRRVPAGQAVGPAIPSAAPRSMSNSG